MWNSALLLHSPEAYVPAPRAAAPRASREPHSISGCGFWPWFGRSLPPLHSALSHLCQNPVGGSGFGGGSERAPPSP